jgi:hypothetical protein
MDVRACGFIVLAFAFGGLLHVAKVCVVAVVAV